MRYSLARCFTSEFLGTAFLVAAIVGSGIMAERLSGGNVAVALLANTLSTGAALVALILVFRPISGAHLNPVVSLIEGSLRKISWSEVCVYITAQIAGGIAGALCANLMFALPVYSFSHHARTGAPQWFSEFIATFGLIFVIRACVEFESKWIPIAVACYIVAAYWFTSSTSFANPAVSIARSLSDTFAGIRPADVPLFIVAQICGGFSGSLIFDWISQKSPAPLLQDEDASAMVPQSTRER